MIRVMCSGRVDLEFLLRSFANGHDGVFVGGCRLGECNYTTQGNFDALGNTLLCQKIMSHLGIDPARLHIEFMSAADGILLAESINKFTARIKELGPLGQGAGEDGEHLKFKLAAARKLVPYIRLVERERLRVPVKTEKAYREFFGSDEYNRLFNQTIADKFAISQIMALLREQPLSTSEICQKLALDPSEASKHLGASSMQGLIRFDVEQKRFAVA